MNLLILLAIGFEWMDLSLNNEGWYAIKETKPINQGGSSMDPVLKLWKWKWGVSLRFYYFQAHPDRDWLQLLGSHEQVK